MRTLLLLAPIVVLAACQDPDVGNQCSLAWGDGQTPPSPPELVAAGGGEYFQTGNLDCEGLVCIVSATTDPKYDDGGYCSKPCVSNSDCFESETGLVCRQVILDDLFLAHLEQNDPDTYQRYLSDVQSSSYCAVPR